MMAAHKTHKRAHVHCCARLIQPHNSVTQSPLKGSVHFVQVGRLSLVPMPLIHCAAGVVGLPYLVALCASWVAP